MNLASSKDQQDRTASFLFQVVDEQELDSGTDIADGFCGKLKKEARKRTKTINNSTFKRVCEETTEFVKSRDWSTATARHFVALYSLLHFRVYGVECLELGPTDRLRAAGAAGRMLKAHFDNDAEEMAAFMHWVWTREQAREQWRRENGGEGGRIGWLFQFNGKMLTDYKLAQARAKSVRGGA